MKPKHGKDRAAMIEMNKKCHVPRSPLARWRNSYNPVKTYPVPEGITPDPEAYRGDLLVRWVQSRSGKEIREITELENLANMLKGDKEQRVWRKITENKPLNQDDLAYVKIVKETLVDLHKLKYGEKKVNVNTSFKDIRELMWGDKREKVTVSAKEL